MLIDIPLIVQIILIGLAWVMWKVLPSRLPWRIATISVVVLLSVFLHGLSAVPLSTLYGRYAAGTRDQRLP